MVQAIEKLGVFHSSRNRSFLEKVQKLTSCGGGGHLTSPAAGLQCAVISEARGALKLFKALGLNIPSASGCSQHSCDMNVLFCLNTSCDGVLGISRGHLFRVELEKSFPTKQTSLPCSCDPLVRSLPCSADGVPRNPSLEPKAAVGN